MTEINLQQAKIAVIGAGTLGIGIAQLAAMHGHETYVFDVDSVKTQSALDSLQLQLGKRVQNGKMTQEQVDHIFANLNVAKELQQLSDADLIIEAIVEKKEVNSNYFK